jgi:hypothetical protein
VLDFNLNKGNNACKTEDENKSLQNVADEYSQPEKIDDWEVDRIAREFLIKHRKAFEELAK